MKSTFPILLLSALVGCATVTSKEGPAPGVRVRDERLPSAQVRFNSVVILDKSLQSWDGTLFDPQWVSYFWPQDRSKRSKIAVEDTNSRRTDSGTLEVWAMLRNRTDHPLQIEARTQYFDEDRVVVDGPTAWHRIYLQPQSVETYKERSTAINGVEYYYIELREGR